MHRVQAIISRKALAHNLAVAKSYSAGSRVVAVIKANAYGHGLLSTAEALQDADLYAVTDIDEAEQLRAGGTDKNIVILQGIIERSDIRRIAAQGFQVVIHDVLHLQWLEEELATFTVPQALTFWLKLDSGMGRLGIPPQHYARMFETLQSKPWTASVVLMTHFANASLPDSPLNAQQAACFQRTLGELGTIPRQTSSASSSVLLTLPQESDFIRPGIMLYGSSPFAWSDVQRRREVIGLRAVMTLQARLISVRDLQPGDNVGYCSQFVCPLAMRVGIVSIGYADGYPSNAPNDTPVSINGKRSRIIGRVSMDMLAIDLSELPEARSGDAVTLWGDDVSIDEVAAHTGILSYNLMCSMAPRVPRLYV